MPAVTPDWVKDAVFYQIFPDRFATSGRDDLPANLVPWGSTPTRHGFQGGDFPGMQSRLDYLVDLGINAIYFNPIFQSAANHRYHTHDYHRVDPILGGTEAFRAFLDAAHGRGIRVVLDGVFNHASRGFLQFNHIMENGERSPYVDWFIAESYPLNGFDEEHPPNYEAWWENRELPKLNTDNPQVRAFLMDVAETWLRFGIDGWRLDVPLEITTPGFWEEFRGRVKAINPEAYILAEIWEDAGDWLGGDPFDATMNYSFNRACYGFFGGGELDVSEEPGGYEIEPLSGPGFAKEISRLLALYDWDVTLAQYNLLSSHDEPRFMTMVNGDRRRLRLATLYQMAFPGPPSIYYGDEIGMTGGPDPDCRRAFVWDETSWDLDLLADFRRFTSLRHEHSSLRRGTYTELLVSESAYVFARQSATETAIVALNVGDEPADLAIDVAARFGAHDDCPYVFADAWTKQSVALEAGTLKVRVPSLDGRVLICRHSP